MLGRRTAATTVSATASFFIAASCCRSPSLLQHSHSLLPRSQHSPIAAPDARRMVTLVVVANLERAAAWADGYVKNFSDPRRHPPAACLSAPRTGERQDERVRYICGVVPCALALSTRNPSGEARGAEQLKVRAADRAGMTIAGATVRPACHAVSGWPARAAGVGLAWSRNDSQALDVLIVWPTEDPPIHGRAASPEHAWKGRLLRCCPGAGPSHGDGRSAPGSPTPGCPLRQPPGLSRAVRPQIGAPLFWGGVRRARLRPLASRTPKGPSVPPKDRGLLARLDALVGLVADRHGFALLPDGRLAAAEARVAAHATGLAPRPR